MISRINDLSTTPNVENILLEISALKDIVNELRIEVHTLRTTIELGSLDDSVQKVKDAKLKPSMVLLCDLYENHTLSARSCNILRRAGFKTIDDLSYITRRRFCRIRGVGGKTLTEIEDIAKAYGIEFTDNAKAPQTILCGDTVIATIDIPRLGINRGDTLTITQVGDSLSRFEVPNYICIRYGTNKEIGDFLSASQITKA